MLLDSSHTASTTAQYVDFLVSFPSICVPIRCLKEAPFCSISFHLTKNSVICLVLKKWATKLVSCLFLDMSSGEMYYS